MTDTSRTRHVGVGLTVLGARLVAEVIWRWQDVKSVARACGVHLIQRWARGHGLGSTPG